MEFHDQHWKRELAGFADEIAQINIDSEAADLFVAERPIFYSAFIVRKLIEDTAVTDSLKSRFVEVQTCHSKSSEDLLFLAGAMEQPLALDEHFDLSKKSKIRITYEDLTSEIVHSDGFVWDASSPSPHAFVVFSYRNRLKRLLYVPVNVYLGMLRMVLRDKPQYWWKSKDLKSGKITTHAAAKKPQGTPVVQTPSPEFSAGFAELLRRVSL